MTLKTILLQLVWCWASKMPRLTGLFGPARKSSKSYESNGSHVVSNFTQRRFIATRFPEKKIDDLSKMLHLLSSFKLMFFKTKSKKSHQNKYLPRFGKLYSLKFPQLHSSRSVTWGRYTARKASLREFFSLFNEPFCLQMNFVTAGCWFFNRVNLGQATFKIQKVGRDVGVSGAISADIYCF